MGSEKQPFRKIQYIQSFVQPHVRHCLCLPPFLFIQQGFQGVMCSLNDCLTCGRVGNAKGMSDTPLFQKLVKCFSDICWIIVYFNFLRLP